MKSLAAALKDAWRLARPYFGSEERWTARLLLASVIALNLSLVGMNVVLSFWNRQFFNSLQEKDFNSFINLLFLYRRGEFGFMPGFCEIVAVYILVAVYRTYLQQALEIRWRRWLTGRFLDEWLADRAYYRISLTTDRAAVGTDNPDQRVAEDVRDFVSNTLSLGLSLISNVVSLFSFLGILWSLSGAVTLLGITIPGYMLWVAVVYAVLGTWLTHLIGRPLVGLNFRQQRVEADFRYALVRVRENMEGIALYGGEAEEKGNLRERFVRVYDNWWSIMRRTKKLNALIFGYNQLAVIFPFVVAAPRYFSGALQLGGLTQTADAFGRVQDSLSWFVTAYSSLAEWRAIVQRLSTFHGAIVGARALAGSGPAPAPAPPGEDALALENLTLALPDGTQLLEATSLRLPRGASVVVTGRSGSGKSTLFRALAGIWPFGGGRVARPAGTFMFLPQRPYIPLGTLSHVVTYPADDGAFPRAAVEQALRDVGLGEFAPALDLDENWPQRLSGGEQQRLALARALLVRPDWLFLDEATASLDPDSEADAYRVLKERLPGTTIVSIAHRPSVAALHDRRLVFRRTPGTPGKLVPDELPRAAE
jgi:putative ATP-binding cassette transporter